MTSGRNAAHWSGFCAMSSRAPGRTCRTVVHFSTPTRVHSHTEVDLRTHPNHPQINTQVVTLAGPGWRDRSKLSGWPWIRRERGGLWPGDSAVSPTSGVLSRRPATRPATTTPLTGIRPRRAGPATRRRGLGAWARERARHWAADAPDWHRVRWAGPGTPAGWQLRGTGGHGVAQFGARAHAAGAARPDGSGPVVVVMVRTPHHEDPRCCI